MKNKLYRLFSSPGAQMISFSTLMFAGDKIGGPLFILLFLNTFFGDLNFSLFGWLCYLIPIICIYKKNQFSFFLQLVSTILMISFVVSLFGPSYFTHFIFRFSTQEVAIMSISYGFFILVNLAVFLKFVKFFKFRFNQS